MPPCIPHVSRCLNELLKEGVAVAWKGLAFCRKEKIFHRVLGHAQVQFSPDGRWLVSASFDKSIKLWDGVKGTFAATFRGHVGPVYQIAWSSDSRMIVSGSKDSTLKVRLQQHRKVVISP